LQINIIGKIFLFTMSIRSLATKSASAAAQASFHSSAANAYKVCVVGGAGGIGQVR
jgi:hypothetical protein